MKTKKIISFILCTTFLLAFLPKTTAKAGTYYFLWPLPNNTGLTACYGDGRSHWAIDIAAPKGTPVIASASGTVVSLSTSCSHNYGKSYACCSSTGNYVRIKNDITLDGKTTELRYCHLTSVNVSVGQYVRAGDVIGTVGSTGYSTGNHLDFKLFVGGTAVDPGPYLQIPTNLYYAGSRWSCCGPYVQKLKSYNNTEYYNATPQSALKMSSAYDYPILILKGTNFSINGTLSSNGNISKVTASITAPDGTVKVEKSVNPNSKSYDLKNIQSSGLLNRFSFSGLAAGHYVYQVTAQDEFLSEPISLIYAPFTVTANAGMAAMFGYSYPESLKPGQSFSIKGTVASINPISKISASVETSAGATVLSASASPNTTTYDLAKLDSAIKFGNLPEGTYYYKVEGTDSAGNTVTVFRHMFYVTNKIGIIGEISLSGYIFTLLSGTTLEANIDVSPSNARFSYQWYADDEPISGATSKTFYVPPSYEGKSLYVIAKGTGDYYGEIQSPQTPAVSTNWGGIIDIPDFSIDIINGTVSPAPAGLTVRDLLDGISDFGSMVFSGVYDDDLNKLTGDDILATGYTLRSMLGPVTIVRYFVVVQGDLNGDGSVSTTDARLALRGAVGIDKLSKAQTAAGDVDNSGGVSVGDARSILRAAVNIEKLPQIL